MSAYPESDSHNETLLTLAKLDFNLLQQVHQKELSEITRWWKDLNFTYNLSFARDRVVESYFWALGVYFEPEYSFARKTLCKFIAMKTVVDIYDVYGKLDNSEVYLNLTPYSNNESVFSAPGWDVSAMDPLPEYMKLCYQALLDLYTEIEEKLLDEGNSYAIYHARESMKIHVRGYLHEARWFHQNYTPTLDEYMTVAVSTSLFMLSITSVVGMGTIVTIESLDWLFNDPKIVNSTSVIGRLRGDIVSHEFEQKRGHLAPAVECYLKEHGAPEEEAETELNKQVSSAWKDVNEACIHPTRIPMLLLMRPLNLARTIEVIYKFEDCFTQTGAELEGFVKALLIDPMPA
ncbi:hypothetical protein ACLB2K_025980 [Fragaria x ananassa]